MVSVRVVLVTNGGTSLSNNIAGSSKGRIPDSLPGDADSTSARAPIGY